MFSFNSILFCLSSTHLLLTLSYFQCAKTYILDLFMCLSIDVANAYKQSMSCLFDVLLSYSSMPSWEGNVFENRSFVRSPIGTALIEWYLDEHCKEGKLILHFFPIMHALKSPVRTMCMCVSSVSSCQHTTKRRKRRRRKM